MPPRGSGKLKNSGTHHKFLFLKLLHVQLCHIRVKSSSLRVICPKLLITDEKIKTQDG